MPVIQSVGMTADMVAVGAFGQAYTVYNREVLGELARFVGPDPAEIARAVIEEFRAPTAPKRDIEDRAAENYSWASVCTAYEETIRRMVTLKHPAA